MEDKKHKIIYCVASDNGKGKLYTHLPTAKGMLTRNSRQYQASNWHLFKAEIKWEEMV